MMSSPPNASLERQQQIAQAALNVFSRQGLNAPMEAIAIEAGVSKGTLYLYFDSKEQLIEALLLMLFDEDLLVLKEIVEMPGSVTQRLMDYARLAAGHFAIMSDHMTVAFELFAIAARNESFRAALTSYYERFWDLVGTLLQQGVDTGELRHDLDTEQTARRLIALWDGEMMTMLINPRGHDLQQSFEHGAQTILQGIIERAPSE